MSGGRKGRKEGRREGRRAYHHCVRRLEGKGGWEVIKEYIFVIAVGVTPPMDTPSPRGVVTFEETEKEGGRAGGNEGGRRRGGEVKERKGGIDG